MGGRNAEACVSSCWLLLLQLMWERKTACSPRTNTWVVECKRMKPKTATSLQATVRARTRGLASPDQLLAVCQALASALDEFSQGRKKAVLLSSLFTHKETRHKEAGDLPQSAQPGSVGVGLLSPGSLILDNVK